VTVIPFAHELRRLAPGSVLGGEDIDRFREPLGRLVGPRATTKILETTGAVGVMRMPADELAATANIPLRLAERVVAARDLGLAAVHPAPRVLRTSADVILALPPGFRTLETEVFLAFALTANLAVKATIFLARGADVGLCVNLRTVFVPLVRLAAASFIVAHNHPSSTADPSREDLELTRRLAEAGKVMGIELLDHVIVTPTNAVSLCDLGILGGVSAAA
jgi:DNA repair protein RadC